MNGEEFIAAFVIAVVSGALTLFLLTVVFP